MFRNYLNIGLRTFMKNKTFSLISTGGLSISLTAVLLIFIWVRSEYQMNKFPEKRDNLFLVSMLTPMADGSMEVDPTTTYPLIREAKNQIPEVQEIVYWDYPEDRFFQLEDQLHRSTGSYGSFAVFDVFSFPILIGEVQEASKNIKTMVITEDFAKNVFGENWRRVALGQTLKMDGGDELEIVAVCANPPSNSTLQFSYVLNIDHRIKEDPWLLNWGNTALYGYLLLNEGANISGVEEKLHAIVQDTEIKDTKMRLQRFSENYLYGKYDAKGYPVGGRIEYVRIFSLAAIFLLLIACINFINLASARASKRAKEVTVRKVVGASRAAIITQFLLESFAVILVSIGFSIFLTELSLPWLEHLMNKELNFSWLQAEIWLTILGLIVFTTLLSGSYPAFVVASFNPLEVMKGKSGGRKKAVNFREVLVITQFVLSTILIVFALIVQQQINYIKDKNLGLDKENIIYMHKDPILSEKFDLLKKRLLKEPGVEDVTATSHIPIDIQSSTDGVKWPGKQPKEEYTSFELQWADYNYLDLFKIQLAEGRFYQEDMRSDSNGLVINQKAAEVMGLEDPIGKQITFWGDQRQIIGVMKDFHTRSLYEPIQPMVVLLDPGTTWSMFIRTKPNESEAALASLERVMGEVVPSYQLEYAFLDEKYQRRYHSELMTGILANYFALVSILISCLGLLGLVTFLIQQRTKEIGVRKVLGASIAQIVKLFSFDFLKLVIIAIVVALPIAWYLVNQWLQNFAYHVDLQWTVFLIAGLGAIIVAFATVSFQSIRAALANPVDALRNE